MSIALSLLAVGAVAGFGPAGTDSICLSADSAEVYIVGSGGDLRVEASGLEPGSALRYERQVGRGVVADP